jgi:hypothetical protein
MQTIQIIDFRRTRDFSRKMNATFEFIRQNFRQLGKSILFISGPPILMASVLIASFFGDMINMASAIGDTGNFGSFNFWLKIVLAMIFFTVSTVTTIGTINNYMILYSEKRSNRIEVSEVWERVRSTFWMYLSTTFLFTVLSIIVYIGAIIPSALLGAVSPVLGGLGMLGAFVFLIWVFISCSLLYAIRAFEDRGFMDALSRSFNLIRGKWWSTFGLVVILYLIMLFTCYFVMLGGSLITLAFTTHSLEPSPQPDPSSGAVSVLLMIGSTLYMLFATFLYALPSIGIVFQYFNLVERKEAKHLISEIETIGESPAPPPSATDEQY